MGTPHDHTAGGIPSPGMQTAQEWVCRKIRLKSGVEAPGSYYLLGDRADKIPTDLPARFDGDSWSITVPPLNAGNYRIFRKAAPGGAPTADEEWCRLRVEPYKITEEQLHSMLEEVQCFLPLRIADCITRLQTGGEAPLPLSGFALYHEKPPAEKGSGNTSVSPAAGEFGPERLANIWRQELVFLKTLLEGSEERRNPGFLKILGTLRNRYLRNLHPRAVTVPAYRLRHPGATNLKRACREGNLFQGSDGTLIFKNIEDRRPDLHPDVHENRVMRLVHDMLAARLASLLRNFEAQGLSGRAATDPLRALAEEARRLRRELARARAAVPFLDRVGRLKILPPRVTAALMKLAPYKSALDILKALNQHLIFSLYKDNLECFLDNTPALYQKWCSLLVMNSVLETLIELKRDFERSDPESKIQIKSIYAQFKKNGPMLFMDLLSKDNNILTIKLVYKKIAREILLTLERNFIGASSSNAHAPEGPGPTYRSLSFDKRPDICLEIKTQHESSSDQESVKLLLFDPKYKKYSRTRPESGSEEPRADCPRNDIDKMHTYRDSIVYVHSPDGPRQCVDFAAILHPSDFPGEAPAGVEYYTFGRLGGVAKPDDPRRRHGVGAVRCVPRDRESRKGIDKIVYAFLAAELEGSKL